MGATRDCGGLESHRSKRWAMCGLSLKGQSQSPGLRDKSFRRFNGEWSVSKSGRNRLLYGTRCLIRFCRFHGPRVVKPHSPCGGPIPFAAMPWNAVHTDSTVRQVILLRFKPYRSSIRFERHRKLLPRRRQFAAVQRLQYILETICFSLPEETFRVGFSTPLLLLLDFLD